MMLRAGEQVGQYKIISELGRGGMATVYKAHHAKLDRHVAIKVMHQNYAEDSNFTERFKREAQIVARLDHPHIVPVYDFDEYRGMPYLVMKIVQGRSLKQMLFKKPPTLDEIIHIMTAVAEATTYAHNQGILHRDIKPSNIVIDGDNIPYLADFGLARIAAAGESTMSADVLLGTPHYMSPEQARGLKTIDYRSDLYSLGIVLYELIVGQVPFSSPTPLAVIQDHIHTPLPMPSEINPEIPSSIEQVLKKALAKNPADRYDTANEMIEEFTAAIHNENIESLADDRRETADESLTRWREEYLNDDSQKQPKPIETENLVESVRKLAQPSVVEDVNPQSPMQPNTQSVDNVPKTSSYTTATRVRHEPYGRFWMMFGAGLFILSMFLIATVILNASNTFIEIADLANRMDTKRTVSENDAPNPLLMDIPNISVSEALSEIDANIDNAVNYLSLAKAYYRDNNIDDARLALNDGRGAPTNLNHYLATATAIADAAGDTESAMIYGILLWNNTENDTSDEGQQAFTNISKFLYDQSVEKEDLGISQDSDTRITERLSLNDAQSIIRSPITRIIVTNHQIELERPRHAEATLETWTDATYMLPIGQLVQARYEILVDDIATATNVLNQLVEASTTPPWIVTIAADLINEIED